VFEKHKSACSKRGGCKASAHCIVSDFDVTKYLHELRQRLPYVPPISVDDLKSLHKAKDHKGIVRLVKRAMNIEHVTFQVFWVPPGAANDGEHKDSPAWVELPRDMPFYGTQAFKDLAIKMFFRKEFFEQAYDEATAAVAHELSHVVLESTHHPFRSCEKVVDLTAMLLGFSRLYDSACHKERRVGNSVKSQKLGYLSREEVQLANQSLLVQGQGDTRTKPVQSMPTLIASLKGVWRKLVQSLLAMVAGLKVLGRRVPVASKNGAPRRLGIASIAIVAVAAYAVTFVGPTLKKQR
jgi:hypothetical protein